MPRPRSAHVHAVKKALLERLAGGYQFNGGRFPSARELAQRYTISYQTADRLLRELVAEGHVQRRAGAGTFLTRGSHQIPRRVALIFGDRAKRKGSFGRELLERMEARLQRLAIPYIVRWNEADGKSDELPVVWETPGPQNAAAAENRYFLLLNDRPSPGLAATWIDSVSVDDFSGGAAAAQVLQKNPHKNSKFLIFGGPSGDLRSKLRIAGFHSILPKTRVVSAETWYVEPALQAAPQLLKSSPDGIFCCNDRLAQAALQIYARGRGKRPAIIGFDDAPIAREFDISTIALPWADLVETACTRISRRLSGDAGHAMQILLASRPILRGSTA